MKVWLRSPFDQRCGYCDDTAELIRRGEPMAYVTLPGSTRRLVRCAAHAGEPMPDTIPPLRERVWPAPRPLAKRETSFAATSQLGIDWKAKQTGDGE